MVASTHLALPHSPDSIFFVARRREQANTGQYETEVEPELHGIARERVTTLWAGGKGIGGADLLMAAVGAGLRAYTRFCPGSNTPTATPVPAEHYLREVEGVVLDVMLDEIFGLRGTAVGAVDALAHPILYPVAVYLPRVEHRGRRRLRVLLPAERRD